MNKKWQLSLWKKILIALILGSIAGLVLGDSAAVLAPIGQLFMNAISMLVIPLVFVSVVCSVMTISDATTMRRVSVKTIVLYLGTMAIAACIGVGIALLLQPGMGLPKELVDTTLKGNEALASTFAMNKKMHLGDAIASIIPSNIFRALANGDMLPTIIFALLIGLTIMTVGKPGRLVGDFFQSAMSLMFKAVDFILIFTPIGVFCLIAQVVGTVGVSILKELSLLIVTVWVGCILNALLVYVPVLMANGLNPLTFFRKMMAPMVFAFSTTSSAATLPLNLETVHQRLGVSNQITDFVLPLGCTINMNGASVYLGVTAIFVANIYGIDLSLWQFMLIILSAIVGSIGAAGVPMVAVFMMTIVLETVGLPIEAIALIVGVDRVIDVFPTTLNITGDAFTAVLVAKSEDQLDQTVYNNTTV